MEYKKKYSILIVDDNSLFQKSLKLLLHDVLNGQINQIDLAENGSDAINKVKQSVYDVVFMDIDMPVMNGIEATKYLNRHYPYVVVIAISFHSELPILHKMIAAGSRMYIQKTELGEDKIRSVFSLLYQRNLN
jgi:DNA-binding NarL/FixJ family response regulator